MQLVVKQTLEVHGVVNRVLLVGSTGVDPIVLDHGARGLFVASPISHKPVIHGEVVVHLQIERDTVPIGIRQVDRVARRRRDGTEDAIREVQGLGARARIQVLAEVKE